MTLHSALQAALDAGRPERAWDRAATDYQEGRARGRHQARLALSGLVDRMPAAAWTPSRRRLAASLRLLPGPSRPRLGELAFPAVCGEEGRFILARARLAQGEADRLPDGLDEGTRVAAQAALQAVRQLEDRPSLHFELQVEEPERWSGASCGLAVALAALSAARTQPLPERLCATGSVSPQGGISSVGAVAEKRGLRASARPAGRMLVALADDCGDPALIPVATLQEAAAAAWPDAQPDPLDALEQIHGLDRRGQWLEAARAAEPWFHAPDLSPEERAGLGVILLQAANHAGDAQAAESWAAELEAMEVGLTNGRLWAQAIGARAVARIDALDGPGAEQALALAVPLGLPPAARVHLLGPAALAATLRGDLAGALAQRQAALEACDDDERPRCLGDLADALLRLGQPEAALRHCDQALDLCRSRRRNQGYLSRTAAFLHLHRARCRVALGQAPTEADLAPALDLPGLDPWLRARLLLAETQHAPDAVGAALARLPGYLRAAPVIQALADRSRGHLGEGASAARLTALPPFLGLPFDEAARRLPY